MKARTAGPRPRSAGSRRRAGGTASARTRACSAGHGRAGQAGTDPAPLPAARPGSSTAPAAAPRRPARGLRADRRTLPVLRIVPDVPHRRPATDAPTGRGRPAGERRRGTTSAICRTRRASSWHGWPTGRPSRSKHPRLAPPPGSLASPGTTDGLRAGPLSAPWRRGLDLARTAVDSTAASRSVGQARCLILGTPGLVTLRRKALLPTRPPSDADRHEKPHGR
jgi:hypothetical protein